VFPPRTTRSGGKAWTSEAEMGGARSGKASEKAKERPKRSE